MNLAAADNTLFTVSGSFAATPNWVVAPLNYGNYSIVNSGNIVKLHYQSAVLSSATGSASTNQFSLPISVANGSVFCRIVYPWI